MRGFRRDKGRWESVRRQAIIRARYRCQQCGRAGRLEVDHIKPAFEGGDEWDFDNLQVLCRACHIAKTRRESGTQSEAYISQIEAWEAEIKHDQQPRG